MALDQATNKLLSIALVAAMLSTGLIVLNESTGEASAAGESWLTGWGYRKSHIVNPATGAGTNYQALFHIYYGVGTDAAGTFQGLPFGRSTWARHPKPISMT